MEKQEIFGYINHADAVLNSVGVIEVIEFFDYNCAHSKKVFDTIKKLLNDRIDVKIVLKAIPILGELSIYATQIGHAILISDPEKYINYFRTLMDDLRGSNNPIYDVLVLNDINIEKLRKILSLYKPRIDEIIKMDLELADRLGVKGTPTFMINNELIHGIVDLKTFNEKAKRK